MKLERNWHVANGVKYRSRGWQLQLGRLWVRYGVYRDIAVPPDVRLSVWWIDPRPRAVNRTSALLFVVFPRVNANA